MVTNEILEHFRGKNVFITGHTGFKGVWLSYLLYKWGANVTGYALKPNTNPSLFYDIQLDEYISSTFADIHHFENLQSEIIKAQPDFIFHLAAQPLVRYSYKNTVETLNTNIIGTANLLEACKSMNKKCSVVCITTDKVYENKEIDYPYNETDKLGGHDPYSASKAAAEIVIDSYRKSFFANTLVSVASARAGNVIGGGDWSVDRLIPDIIKAIQSGEKIILRNPAAVRPWQHVLDPIMGYLKLAKLMSENEIIYNEAWNFGPAKNETKTVQEVCNKVVQILGKGEIEIQQTGNALHEATLLKLDIAKAQSKLSWQPVWSTEKAIEYTAKWYQNYLENKNALQLMQHDIDLFLNDD
jgi:CDP-glucose 4,6-dehydratase